MTCYGQSEFCFPGDESENLKEQSYDLKSLMSHVHCRSTNSVQNPIPFSLEGIGSSSIGPFDRIFKRHSQQLVCQLQAEEDRAVERRGSESQYYVSCIDQPQTSTGICSRQNQDRPHPSLHLPPHTAVDVSTPDEMKMNRFFGTKAPTSEAKRSRNPNAFAFLSPQKDNERESGIEIESESEEIETADHFNYNFLPAPEIDIDKFRAEVNSETGQNTDAAEFVSDIIKSLDDFIASVTIPPPPPPLQGPWRAKEGSTAGKKQRNSSSEQSFWQNFGKSENLKQLASQNQKRNTTFINNTPEVDFSKLVIPPPPPIDVSTKNTTTEPEESKISGGDTAPLNPTMSIRLGQRPKLPPPLPPLHAPPLPPLLSHLPNLPPLHPKRSSLAARSPSLSPRAASANSILGRSLLPRSPASEKPSVRFKDSTPGATEHGIHSRKQSEETIASNQPDANRRTSVQRTKSNDVQSRGGDASVIIIAPRHRSSSVDEARTTSSSAHARARGATFPKTTAPVPPPRVNSSPQTKRPTRRVSFDQCPPSIKSRSSEGDIEIQRQQHEVGLPQSSSFTKLQEAVMDWTDNQNQLQATAQIRPSALRSSSALGFHSVVIDDEVQPSISTVVSSDLRRPARSGSVGSGPTKPNTSLFTAIRSKLKSYWSPSMPRRKTSLQENDKSNAGSVAVASKTSSTNSVDYEVEKVDGNPKYNSRRVGNWNKNNRSTVFIDSNLNVEEDDFLEFYREPKQPVQKTFNSFTGPQQLLG